MLTMMMLFTEQADADDVHSHIHDRLIPTLKAWPGVESVVASAGPLMSPAGPAPYSHAVVATVTGIDVAMNFGQAAATRDVRVEGEQLGATILFFEQASLP